MRKPRLCVDTDESPETNHETVGSWRDRYWRLERIGWPSLVATAVEECERLSPVRTTVVTAAVDSDHASTCRPPPSPVSDRRRLVMPLSAADLVLMPATNALVVTPQAPPRSSGLADERAREMRSVEPAMSRPPMSPRTPFSRAAALVAQRLDLIDGIQPQGLTQGHVRHYGFMRHHLFRPTENVSDSSSDPIADTAASSKPTVEELRSDNESTKSRSNSCESSAAGDSCHGGRHGGSIMATELTVSP